MAASDAIAAGAPVGRYEIVSLLSAGGMGELYRARDPELGRDLVLKLLPMFDQDNWRLIALLIPLSMGLEGACTLARGWSPSATRPA